jgi:hypothetical protein
VVVGVVSVGVVSVVVGGGVGSVGVVVGVPVVVHAGSGVHDPSAAEPAAAVANAAAKETKSRAGRDALGTAWNINDTVRGCAGRS